MKHIDLVQCLSEAKIKAAGARNEKVRSAYTDLASFYERQLARTTSPKRAGGNALIGTLRREPLPVEAVALRPRSSAFGHGALMYDQALSGRSARPS